MQRFFTSLLLTVVMCFVTCNYALARKPRTVFNDDAQFLFEMENIEDPVGFVKAWLDREMNAIPFSTFVFLAATPDVCTYEAKVGEVYADRRLPGGATGWAPGIRSLRAAGTDALKLVTEHMKAHGKEVLAAIRLSDTHHVNLNPNDPLVPQFAIDNPQFVIKQPDGRENETALDYSYPEVRAHRLAIMREIVENYDVDGLELNFVRWAKHFPRHQGREKAPIMTDFMQSVRSMLDEVAESKGRKRPFTLGIRVPESIDTCWLAGVDIETWVNNDWISYIVVSTWNNTDPQVGLAEFTRFAKPNKVDLIVVMGNMMGGMDTGPPFILDRPVAMSADHAKSYLGMLLTPSEARGAAANFYTWGADSISFWNVGVHFGKLATGTTEQIERMRNWTHAVSSKRQVFNGTRTYRYLPMGKGMSTRAPPFRNYPWYDEGHSPLGHKNGPVIQFSAKSKNERQAFPFLMADGRKGEELDGLMTFWVYNLESPDQIKIDVNRTRIDPEHISSTKSGLRRGGIDGYRFEISLSQCPAFSGNNELGLTLMSPNETDAVPYMEELEVVVEKSPRRTSKADDNIKIMIAVDTEGPTGVNEYWARNLKDGDPKIEYYRRLLTNDVNAAIEGCFQGGATEVYLRDDGFRDRNVIIGELDPRVKLVSGYDFLLQGLDNTFDGVMLVGLHAMEGSNQAVLPHTWSSSRRRQYWFNGQPAGEIAAYAVAASHQHSVPIIMVTGCNGTCSEATELLGRKLTTVEVKSMSEDGSITLYPPEVTFPKLVAGAKHAVQKLEEMKPYPVEFPLHVRLELKDKETTDGYIQWRKENKPAWPGRRAGDNAIEAELLDILHLIL